MNATANNLSMIATGTDQGAPLSSRGMLVSQSIRQWSARKHDKQISAEVDRNHNATGAGRFNKVLIAKTALADITKIVSAARGHHYSNSLPWMDNGARILPAANYWAYMQAQSAYRQQFETAARAFIADYPAYIEEARRRLNGLFNGSDYPADIAARFSFSLSVYPLPDASDWRVDLGAEEVNAIRADIEARTAETMGAAMRELWERLYTAVSHMHERLATDGGRFHGSLVDNIRELVELLPRLNITGDSDLERMRQEIAAKLTKREPDALRQDSGARKAQAADAAAILETMAGYMGDL